MKTKILIAVFGFLFVLKSGFSQDTLVYRNGDVKVVTVVKSTPELIEFKYPNEELINTEYKKSLTKIVYASGRTEECSATTELAVINGVEDWEKVILTNNPNEVKGLTQLGEVSGKSGTGGLASKTGYKKAREKIKKAAAELGAPIVLVQKDKYGFSGAVIIGIAYK